ncbi:MAG: efflux RND transporter periplasmic adaptor subunit [Krumholzibacteria bacterium]|nr:efflux RND transporter periplasmic adaptor subunit [Candidatus Krumholzibacteria bacterium]
MKKFLVVLALVVIAGAVIWRVRDGRGGDSVNYRFVEIAKGDLAAVVASTGTLEPVTTVQVGTQVSGIIQEVAVDFNDHVTAGQVIARIDTTLMAANVASARTQVQRGDADVRHSEREFARLGALFAENMISEADYNTAQYNLDVARASLAAARIDLDRARRNLDYATITAPIDGIVVQRTVDPGQTVQASFSAPELFQIAGDLTLMQILVSVDESDIGQIVEGQAVRFTVQAWPDGTFAGEVRQVRLQSVMQENVVNYIAVVTVANPDGRLLPGMTATVDFIVDQATDVFYVPNAALRYRPDQAVMQAALERRRAARQDRQASGQQAEAGEGQMPGGGTPGAGGTPPADRGMLWIVDQDGRLDVIMVRTGISDGTNTEIRGRDLEAGTRVIAGIASSNAAQAAGSPFQQQQRPAGGPPRPGGF